MVSSSDTFIQNLKEAIANKISSLISTHNSSSSAHSTEMAKKLDISQSSYKGKNVVVDSTSGNISFEDKYSHPSTKQCSATIPTKTSDLTNDGDGTNVFVKNDDSRLSNARTPTSHASSTTAYGAASTSNYGHAKLYDGVDSSSASLAATANAVKTAYDEAAEKADANHTHTASEIGFTAGTNFGDAAPNITDTSAALNYIMGNCNLKANITDVPSLTPTQVYNCTSWNNTYTDSSATRQLTLFKLGPIYMLRYFMTTKTLTYAATSYNMNSDTIPSEHRPGSDRTFNIATSSAHTAKLTITSGGKIQISADTNSLAISFSGTVVWWW